NGFIVPALIEARADLGDSLHAMEEASHVISVSLVYFGIPAMSLAVLAWSSALLRRGGGSMAPGVTGLFCGLIPILAEATGHLPVSVHGFGAFVLLQSIWYVTVGVQMIRRRL